LTIEKNQMLSTKLCKETKIVHVSLSKVIWTKPLHYSPSTKALITVLDIVVLYDVTLNSSRYSCSVWRDTQQF